MSFRYDKVVPWGRSYEEYLRMFALTPEDLTRNILGCGDGPASFNSRLSGRGGRVVSADPLYHWAQDRIEQRIEQTFATVIGQTAQNKEKFNWDVIPSVEVLGEIRMKAMQEFLGDYESGKSAGRYVDAALPRLPFEDHSFDLALSSHLLFFYSDNLALDFHLESVRELCRVASEVRIFPIVDVNARVSPYVEPVLSLCRDMSCRAELVRVDYAFQKNGHTMLRICQG